MRPFWIHQLVEYVIGIAIISQGIQDPKPAGPALAGLLVIINAAIVRGPMSAFRWVGRRVHRWLDLVMMALIALIALQPWADVSATGRGMMLVFLIPLGFLWFYTDWAERPARKQRRVDSAGATGEQVGRTAGRLAGSGYRAIKNRTRSD